MRVRSVGPAIVLVLAAGLGACAPPDLTPDASPTPAAPAAPAPAEDDPFAGAPSPRPPTICDRADLDAIDEVIAEQLDAFAAGDWEAALDLASSDFREEVDAEAFEALIEVHYPVAADAAEHRSQTCVTPRAGTAEVRVELTGAGGGHADLVYLLVDEEGWRIAGAAAVEVRDPDATTV